MDPLGKGENLRVLPSDPAGQCPFLMVTFVLRPCGRPCTVYLTSSCSRVRKRLWADEVDEAFVDGDHSEDEALLGNDQSE